MAHNFQKTQGKDMTFTQFCAECLIMFGSQTKKKKKIKVSAAAHTIEESTSIASGNQRNCILRCLMRKRGKGCQVQTVHRAAEIRN